MFNGKVIVGEQAVLDVGFAVARARLMNLVHGSLLLDAAREAYGEGITGPVRVGPLGFAPGLSKLVEVQFRDLVQRGGSAVLTLRWQATGGGGKLFPVLDADITLSPDTEHTTVLAMAGAYRPPLGAMGAGLDRVILRRAAMATIRGFVNRLAGAIAHPAPAANLATGTAEPPAFRLPLASEEP
jgi:hypothetical protein